MMSRFGAGGGPITAATRGDDRSDFLSLCCPETRVVRIDAPLELEGGGWLTGFDVAYRTWGKPSATASLVCHALTGSADVDDWWPGLIEPGGPLEASSRFVVCSNVIGSCYGSEGPSSGLDEDGRVRGLSFPRLSIRDMVRAQALWLEAIGVERLEVVIGGSMGGMQVLEWAVLFPELVDVIVPVAVSARHSAWCVGISATQRRAIEMDPGWQGGSYRADNRPRAGLDLARRIAMVSYRSHASFGERFGRDSGTDEVFAVEDYLTHHGSSLVGRFDPACYYRLTQAMDTHDLARDRGTLKQVLGSIQQPALIVGVDSDVLYPLVEQQELAQHLPNARLAVVRSNHGHDGFLIEQDQLAAAVSGFL